MIFWITTLDRYEANNITNREYQILTMNNKVPKEELSKEINILAEAIV